MNLYSETDIHTPKRSVYFNPTKNYWNIGPTRMLYINFPYHSPTGYNKRGKLRLRYLVVKKLDGWKYTHPTPLSSHQKITINFSFDFSICSVKWI
jgi:hypothetical protein